MKKSLLIALISLASTSAFAAISPGTLYFPPFPCHEMHTESLTFYNTSNSVLSNVNATISGNAFSVQSTCPLSMPPQSSCTLQVTYWPQQVGPDYAILKMDAYPFSNDAATIQGSCF